MGAIHEDKAYALKIRESANDGSDFSNPEADYRILFLGEDGHLHVRDSAGNVTEPFDPDAAAGTILQVVTAVSTTDDSTVLATMQDSSLAASITPQAADSILIIEVDGECNASRAAGSPDARHMWVGIRNETDAVDLVEQVRGVVLAATSSALAAAYAPIALQTLYTVDSTAARTFRLRYRSTVATNVQAFINGSRTGGILMKITEVAA